MYERVRTLLHVTCISMLSTGCVAIQENRTLTVDPKRGQAPQSEGLIRESENAGADKHSPVLIRIFKESNELELWRKNKETNKFVLVHTYPICRYSGTLGPKMKIGDRQAPEGFYEIGPSSLNPYSVEFVSLNTGYPNKFDRSHNRTGAHLMIHGGCSSAGCYAITHAAAQEVFTAVRDSLKAGQRSVQLQIYPFRMDAYGMAAHFQNDRNRDFWQQLKAGYDKFQLTQEELNVTVVNKKYVVQ